MAKRQTSEKIHFIANPSDQKSVDMQTRLIAQYGQADTQDAETVCAIGGDGSLIYALRDAFNKQVIGLCRKDSNSVGFWMNHVDPDNTDLNALTKNARRYTLRPLKVDITHNDGSHSLRYAFTDAVLASNNGQASLCHVYDREVSDAPWRIMGNGLTFATPFGSSAKAYAEGGSALDLNLNAYIMAGSGVCSPLNFKSYTYPAETVLEVHTDISRAKRDQRIDIDGQTYQPPKGLYVTGFNVSIAEGKQSTLLLDRPARTAFKTLTHDV